MRMKSCGVCLAVLAGSLLASAAQAEDKVLELGKHKMTAPAKWTAKQPKFQGIVKYEFSVAPAEGDKGEGRVTIGPLGGGTQANLDRWMASFKVEGDKDEIKPVEKEIAGAKVYIVDVTGVYTAPPFAGGGVYKDYRLLGAMIETEDGSHYIKFLGPKRTVANNEKAFNDMLKGMKKAE